VIQIGERNPLHVHVYRRTNGTERLTRVSGSQPVQLPTWKLTRVRTILYSLEDGSSGSIPLKYLKDALEENPI
jgi:hypothetical protein